MRNGLKARFMSYLFLMGLLIGLPIKVSAASITVNATCSLSDAITAANTDAAAGGCSAGSGADTITLTGHLTLPESESNIIYYPNGRWDPVAGALPIISSDITIQGGGYTISGDNAYRIFHVSRGRVTINNVVLTLGAADLAEGGALYVGGGNVSVKNSSFTDNTAYWGAAIYNNGNVSISSSVFDSNAALLHAGAIKNAIGTMTISGGRFTNNTAHDHSGAIFNGHTLTIGNSTFLDNTVESSWSLSKGGAISTDPSATTTISGSTFGGNSAYSGGAIRNFSTLNVSNSTFYGNTATEYGGAIKSSSSATITHSTIVDNTAGAGSGGGVSNRSGGTINLRNSIIAGNHGGDCAGGLSQNVNNLIQDGTCSPALSGDPKLGALIGSPAYFPLQADSPAIDAAHTDHCSSTDQAGNSRPYPAGGACDIGASELQSVTSTATPAATVQAPPIPVEPTATPIPPTSTPVPTEVCVEVSSGTYWLFPYEDSPWRSGGFLSGLITEYPSIACDEEGEYSQISIGDLGYAYTTAGQREADRLCWVNHVYSDAVIQAAEEPSEFNSHVWACQPRTAQTATGTPVVTSTPLLSSIDASTAQPGSAEPTATATDSPARSCVNVGPGTYWLFPASNFLNGSVAVYTNSECDDANGVQTSLGDNGYVYTAAGQVNALLICIAAHNDGQAYTVVQQAFNSELWQCVPSANNTPVPTATNSPVPPTHTPSSSADTPVPSATNTPAPTNTPVPPTNTPVPAGAKAVTNVQLTSNQPGVLAVSWDAPSQTPRDYRIHWAKVDEDFPSAREDIGNAYPTSSPYAITGLDLGVRYKVKLRARYSGESNGDWTEQVEALVMDETVEQVQQIQQQQEVLESPTNAPVPTNTPIPSTDTPVPTDTPAPPGRPNNLTASAVTDGVLLTWDAPAGQVNGYEILRRRPRLGETELMTFVADTGSSATTYTDTTATESTRYTYRVKAIRDGVRSKQSEFARVDRPAATNTPLPPTNTPVPTNTSVPPTNTPVPPTDTPVPTNTPVPPTNTPVPTNTSVPPTNTPVPPTDTPVPTNTPAPPGRPNNLTASAVTDGVLLTWDAPAGQVDGYEILRRRPRLGETELMTFVADTGSSATTYTDTTATESTRYTYRVKAIRNGVRGKRSEFARVDR